MSDIIGSVEPARTRRRIWLIVSLAGALVAATVASLSLHHPEKRTVGADPPRSPSPSSATHEAAPIELDYDGTASHLAAAPGFVFVSDWVGGRVLRVTSKGEMRGSLTVGLPQQGPLDLAYGESSLFILDYHDGELWAVDPQSLLVRWKLAIPGEASSINVGQGSVWVTTCCRQGSLELLQIDPTTRRLLKRVRLPGSDIARVRVGAEGLWVAIEARDDLYRLDPRTLAVAAKVHLGAPSTSTINFELGDGWVWAVDSASRVVRIDPSSGKVANQSMAQDADQGAMFLAVNHEACYVSVKGRVIRLDLRTLRPLGEASAGTVVDLAIAGAGRLWVSSLQGLRLVAIDATKSPTG